MKLYEYTDQHREALIELNDLDLPAEIVEDTLNALIGDIEEKTKSVVAYMRNLDADVKAMKRAEQEIKERRQRIERRVVWIDNYVLTNMQANDITEISTPYFTFKPQKNPPAVTIVDESEISDKYKIEVVTYKIDKKKIKEDIKAGQYVAGAIVTQGWRLKIS